MTSELLEVPVVDVYAGDTIVHAGSRYDVVHVRDEPVEGTVTLTLDRGSEMTFAWDAAVTKEVVS